MSERCSSCRSCDGCKDGSVWFYDPRCWPDCSNSKSSKFNTGDWIIIIFIVILAAIALILGIISAVNYYRQLNKVPLNTHTHSFIYSPISFSPSTTDKFNNCS